MLRQKKNIILLITAGLTELCIVIMYHFGIINSCWSWIVISAIAWGVIMIAVNALKHFTKALAFGLSVFMIAAGFGQVALLSGYAIAYIDTQARNLRTITTITDGAVNDSGTYVKIMTYDGYDYYVDSGYTYMYKIKNNGILSEISAMTIYIASDVEKAFSNSFGEFYTVSGNKRFEDVGPCSISISFVKDSKDTSAFIKLVSKQNKVFYTHFPLDDPSQLVEDLGIAFTTYRVGSAEMSLTGASKIVNGTQAGNNEILEYENGKQYIVTVTDKTYLSEASAIAFGNEIGYSDRVNYFLYKDEIADIEEYKKALKDLDAETDEYKEVQGYIAALESQMHAMACEMVYESIVQGNSLRMYRIRNYAENLQTVPSITVIEIERADYYIYGYTDLELDDLF